MLSYTGKEILAAEEAGVDFSAKASQSVIVKPQNSNAEGSIDFHLTPKGKATNANRDPIDVVFVFDKSGSMEDGEFGNTKMDSARSALKEALTYFEDNSRNGDRFAFIPFSDKVEGDLYFSIDGKSNFNAIRSRLDQLTPKGGTNYAAALNKADAFLTGSTNKKYIIFLTDGEPTVATINRSITYREVSSTYYGIPTRLGKEVTKRHDINFAITVSGNGIAQFTDNKGYTRPTYVDSSPFFTTEEINSIIREDIRSSAVSLASKSIKLFSIGFGNDAEVDMEYLRRISEITGTVARQANKSNISSIFQDISKDINNPSIQGEIKVDLKPFNGKVQIKEGLNARMDDEGNAIISFNFGYQINQAAPPPIDMTLPLVFKETGTYTFNNINLTYSDLTGISRLKSHSPITIEVKADAPPGFKGTMNLQGSANTPDNLIKLSGSTGITNEFEVQYTLNPFGLVNNTVNGSLSNLKIVQPLPDGVSLVNSPGAAVVILPDGRKAIELTLSSSVIYSIGRFFPERVTGAFKLKGDWALSNVKMPAAVLYYKDSRFGNQQTTIAASSQVINMKVRLKDTTKQQAYDGDAAGIISKIDLSDNGKKLAQTGFPNDQGLLNKPIMDMRFTDNNKAIEVIYSDGSKATIYLVLDYEMTGVDTGKSYNSSEKANEHVNVKLTKLVAGQGVKYYYKIINEKGTAEWKEFSPDEDILLTEPGENTIMIKAIGGFSATDQPVTKSLTIEKRIESINVSPDPIEVEIDKTAAYNIEILPVDATNKDLEIIIADTEIATLVGDNSVYGHKKGETELIVKTTDGSKLEKRVKIIVKDPYIALQEIKFKKAVYKLEINKKVNIESLLIFNPEKATKKKITEVFTADAKNGSVRVLQDGDDFYLEAAGIGYTTVTAVAEEQRDKSKPKASALFEVVNPDGSGNDGTDSGGRW
ncbi:VWA domain-containing protein [Bacillus infantis]|uniref:VWA domain-containing protein n=1 Tax=Bacillus infantis TaxID=324767 RepID=UPI001CD262C4|nr:VWA domain-containing protein [Bacillus infantis]MCA1038932.1 VWA domain-containing protein [Bacillus infantis]